MMNADQIKSIRRQIGTTVLSIQEAHQHLRPEEVIPQIIGALLSLAGFLSKTNAEMSEIDFLSVCALVANEEWKYDKSQQKDN
jgi:hypothetical protein